MKPDPLVRTVPLIKILRSGTGFSLWRVGAMVMRHLYLFRSSWPRIVDLFYWPTVQMVTWGFLQTYISHGVQGAGAFGLGSGTLIGAVILWDVLFRGELGFALSFLEELYSRNIGNLFMSPLRPLELAAALVVMSSLRLAIGLVPVSGLAFLFFGFNLWGLGFVLVPLFLNLVLTSWSVGLVVSGLLLRNGLGAEGLAWNLMFILLPLSCVYYPVAVLPQWLQTVAWCLPPTYVFEALRAELTTHLFRADLMATAFAINLLLIGLAVGVFLWLVRASRIAGTLLQMGE